MWWRESCAVIAAFFIFVHFIWLDFNILCLSSAHCEVTIKFIDVFEKTSNYLGVFLVGAYARDGLYKFIFFCICIYQLYQSAKLLFGVIVKCHRLLESWLVYDGLVVALAFLRYLQILYGSGGETEDSEFPSHWFWIEFFPVFLSFFLINALAMFAVHELWHYFVEERTAGGRSADIRRFRCSTPQSWMSLMGCLNRLAHTIVFVTTVGLVFFNWTYMKTLGAEEFRLWAMLVLATLGIANSLPLRGCPQENPSLLQVWMRRETIICILTYLLHITEAIEYMDFDFLVLKFIVNEFVMVQAILAAKILLTSPTW